MIAKTILNDKNLIIRWLIVKQGIIAAMKGEVEELINLIELVAYTKDYELKSHEI